MNIASWVLYGAAVGGSLFASERIADPLERHGHDYQFVIQGDEYPILERTTVVYMQANGEVKHDVPSEAALTLSGMTLVLGLAADLLMVARGAQETVPTTNTTRFIK